MKRCLLFLLLPFLLAGCGNPPLPAESSPSASQTLPDGPGLYAPDSVIEQETGGSVKCYPLDDDTYDSVLPLGKDLLLSSRGNTRLTLVTETNLVPAVEKEIPFHFSSLQVCREGITYMDEENSTVIFLTSALREISRLKMPDDMIGQACVSPGWDTVYYCTSSGLRALDLETGISRLVTEQHTSRQSVTGIFLDGKVVRCEMQESDDRVLTRLIASESGKILWEGDNLSDLAAAGDNWFAVLDQDSVQELLFSRDSSIRNLWLEDPESCIFPIPEQNAVLAVKEASWGCRVSYYDLTTGRHLTSVRLENIPSISYACADTHGNGIWLLAQSSTGADLLCHWAVSADETGDITDQTVPHYTRDEPDTSGLQALQKELQDLKETYGVDLLIGESAAAVLPDGCTAETEYLEQAFRRYVPVLKQAMSQFPKDFFKTAAGRSPSGLIHIGLVRSISGTAPDMPVLQCWSNGEFYLVLPLNDALEQNFFHGISHLIETRILSVCTAFYDWDKLNPSDFSYANYKESQNHTLYLSGENKAFIDVFSMRFAGEDRARIMEYACMPGNEAVFQSTILQQKLQTLCNGIRTAFLLQDDVYIWEQYLIGTTE